MRPFLYYLLAGLGLSCLVAPVGVWAQSQRVYRCGNAYTNQPEPNANCQAMSGGSVTVIEGTRVQAAQAAMANAGASGVKVDSTEQRQRDAQAQAVLLAELQKAQKQHADLAREWNNGQPERRPDESRQPQKYQDRLAQLRDALQRAEADVAGLQRELSRLAAPVQTGGKP
jgi:hypothetical protein